MMILLENCTAEIGNEDKFCPKLGIEKLQKNVKTSRTRITTKTTNMTTTTTTTVASAAASPQPPPLTTKKTKR